MYGLIDVKPKQLHNIQADKKPPAKVSKGGPKKEKFDADGVKIQVKEASPEDRARGGTVLHTAMNEGEEQDDQLPGSESLIKRYRDATNPETHYNSKTLTNQYIIKGMASDMQKDVHNKRGAAETKELLVSENIIDSARDGQENPKLSAAASGLTQGIQPEYSNT